MANQSKLQPLKTKLEARKTLLWLWDAGNHDHKNLANITGIPLATVYRTIAKIKNGQGVERRSGSGRPHKLKPDDRRRITQLANHHPMMNCATIAEEVAKRGSPSVSRWTIGRSLRRSGYLKWLPQVVPNMTPQHMQKRVEWCQANLNSDWSKVIFTDESYFQLFRHKVKM